MKHSFIVPTYNEEDFIKECLKSIEKQPVEKEIIVVDGGSQDETLQKAKEFDVKIIENVSGRGKARDKGVEQAEGDFLFFIDADTVIQEQYATKMVKKMEKNNLVAASSRFKMTGYRSTFIEHLGNLIFPVIQPPLLPGFNTAVKKDVYLNSEGYSDVFGEDYQFSKTVNSHGSIDFHRDKLVKTSGRRVSQFGLTGTLIYYSLKNILRKFENSESQLIERNKFLRNIDSPS